jgi:sugar lactone lactonase YvrE
MCFAAPVTAQTMYTYAGTGVAGFSGDAGAATAAKVNVTHGVATDAAGNVYIADHDNNRIRKVSTSGVITTIAGTGFGGYLGDGGAATAAWIKWPIGIAVDASGNIYFSDYGNNVIRKINTSGTISTIAGIGGSIPLYSGDGGPATAANLGNAWGVAVDATGNVYIADALNHRIRKVVVGTGIITTVAGIGLATFSGDGGPATAARLNEPTGVAFDGAGNMYIADNANNRVRKVNTSGIITTIAGIGLPYGYTGDGGPATIAKLYYPKGIAVDNPGNVYICDWNNNCVRKINTSGIITTVTGTGVAGFSGDGGAPGAAQLDHPTGVAVRAGDGDIFISDNLNNRVRHIQIGNAPYFTAGLSKSVIVCPIEFTTIDSALRVDDINVGETETWSSVTLPLHGTLVASYSTLSTGSTITPSGMTYAPALGYVGTDSFKMRVTDGVYSDTIMIYITVLPFPVAGTITGADSVCPGLNITLADTASGGVWSSSNTTLATVSATGVVHGILPGTVVISYTVTNPCGSATATDTIRVIATVPCISGVPGDMQGMAGDVTISPNPGNGLFLITVSAAGTGSAQLVLHDIVGRQVGKYTVPINKPTELLVGEPAGVYLLSIEAGSQKWVRKISIR